MATRIQVWLKRQQRIWIPLCAILFLCLLEFGCARGPRSLLSRFWKSEPTQSERYAEAARRQEMRDQARVATSGQNQPGIAAASDRNAGRASTASLRQESWRKPFADQRAGQTPRSRTKLAARTRKTHDASVDPFLHAEPSPKAPQREVAAQRQVAVERQNPAERQVVDQRNNVRNDNPFAVRAETKPAAAEKRDMSPRNPFAAIERSTRRNEPAESTRPRETPRERRDPFYSKQPKRKPGVYEDKVASVPSLDDTREQSRSSNPFDSGRNRLRNKGDDPRSSVGSQGSTVAGFSSRATQPAERAKSPVNAMTAAFGRDRRAADDRGFAATRDPRDNNQPPVHRQSSMPIVTRTGRSTAPAFPETQHVGMTKRGAETGRVNPFAQVSRSRPVHRAEPIGRGFSKPKVTPGDRSMIVDSALVPGRFDEQTVPDTAFDRYVEPTPEPGELRIVPRTRVKPTGKTTSLPPVIRQASAMRVSAMKGQALAKDADWDAKSTAKPQIPINVTEEERTPEDKNAPLPPAKLPTPSKAAAIESSADAKDESPSTPAESDDDNDATSADGDAAEPRQPASLASQFVLLGLVFLVTMIGYFLRRRRGASRLL